ncbi:MAG: hypothetical protein L6R28_10905 [Planctomycetes bacterium]|nr:hypothetical protein [Planctomycetota bacterium]
MTKERKHRAGRLVIATCAALSLALFVGGCDYESDRDDGEVHDDAGEEPLDHLGAYKSETGQTAEPKAEAPERRRDTAGEEEIDTGAMYAKPAKVPKPEPKAAPAKKPEPEKKAAHKPAPEPQSKARTRAPRELKVELTEARGVERHVTYVPAPPPAPEYRVPRVRHAQRYDDAGEMDLNY